MNEMQYNIKKTLFGLLIVALSAAFAATEAQAQDAAALYKHKCAGCHGLEGDGNGPGAAIVFPRPRDFRTWMFKYKTTPVDYSPTEADLQRIIAKGLPGSSMPAFEGVLTEQEIKSLIPYLKQFAVFDLNEEEFPVVEIKKSPKTPDVEHGKQLFKQLECTKCHGEANLGDGPSFPELEDDWGNRSLPRNHSKPWAYRRGSTLQDIYTTLKLGIPGTSMPSFLETLEQGGASIDGIEFDLWSIAAYVQSVQEPGNFGITIKIKFTETVTDDPSDGIWQDVPSVRFPLIGQVTLVPRHFTPSVEDVLVKAIHNGTEMALLIQWDDPTAFSDSLHDKLVIQLPVTLKERERPFFIFGDKDNPVNLWVFENGELYDGRAESAGTLARQSSNDISGTWQYKDGRYTVVFKRVMNTQDEQDVILEMEKFTNTSFMVWDGYNGEEDLKCAVSTWFFMVPEGPVNMRIYYTPAIVIIITVLLQLLIMRNVRKNNSKMQTEINL